MGRIITDEVEGYNLSDSDTEYIARNVIMNYEGKEFFSDKLTYHIQFNDDSVATELYDYAKYAVRNINSYNRDITKNDLLNWYNENRPNSEQRWLMSICRHYDLEAMNAGFDIIRFEENVMNALEYNEQMDKVCFFKTVFERELEKFSTPVSYNTDTGQISDGYHTFDELYDFRKLYNALLFNEWSKQGKYDVHKSMRHHDGELCFGGGWFVVVAILPDGQITNHYEMKDWDLFDIPYTDVAKYPFDGHGAQDVLTRMLYLLLKEDGIS